MSITTQEPQDTETMAMVTVDAKLDGDDLTIRFSRRNTSVAITSPMTGEQDAEDAVLLIRRLPDLVHLAREQMEAALEAKGAGDE